MNFPVLSSDALRTLDGRITDVGSLISLALALVTVFTTVRSARAGQRRKETLTREDMIGELTLDCLLITLTLGVLLAATPLFLGAVEHLAVGHASGSLRLTFAIVWALLIGLAAWQTTILKSTIKSTKSAWNRRAPS
jgi:hypothetical protein